VGFSGGTYTWVGSAVGVATLLIAGSGTLEDTSIGTVVITDTSVDLATANNGAGFSLVDLATSDLEVASIDWSAALNDALAGSVTPENTLVGTIIIGDSSAAMAATSTGTGSVMLEDAP
jgi:hypothetical protein